MIDQRQIPFSSPETKEEAPTHLNTYNKLGDLRLKQDNQINVDDLGIEVIQSQAGNPNAIEKTIKLK